MIEAGSSVTTETHILDSSDPTGEFAVSGRVETAWNTTWNMR